MAPGWAVFALAAASAAVAPVMVGPEPVFAGAGQGWVYNWDAGGCIGFVEEVDIVLVVAERHAVVGLECLEDIFLTALPPATVLYGPRHVFTLRGSWEAGFTGEAIGLGCCDYLLIGPYGDGRDIAVEGRICFDWDIACTDFAGAVTQAPAP